MQDQVRNHNNACGELVVRFCLVDFDKLETFSGLPYLIFHCNEPAYFYTFCTINN